MAKGRPRSGCNDDDQRSRGSDEPNPNPTDETNPRCTDDPIRRRADGSTARKTEEPSVWLDRLVVLFRSLSPSRWSDPRNHAPFVDEVMAIVPTVRINVDTIRGEHATI